MGLINTFIDRKDDVLQALQEHIILAGIAMLIAIIIAVPLGIILTRFKKVAETVINITAVVQTIPSLALLGFMLPLLGIGFLPAIIALTIYALLPILRNTYAGIVGVDPSLIDAGKGMGMTSFQILFMVELPMTMPILMAGIRTSTVLTIGVAALATFIGAGGLGDLIIRGLNINDTNLILAGAIPAALLAIVFDYVLKKFEQKVTPRGL